jgi:hypothetical protein
LQSTYTSKKQQHDLKKNKKKQSRCCWFEKFKTPAVLSKQTWHSQSKVDGIFGLTALSAVLVQSNTF